MEASEGRECLMVAGSADSGRETEGVSFSGMLSILVSFDRGGEEEW
jgi:hypothetical protein